MEEGEHKITAANLSFKIVDKMSSDTIPEDHILSQSIAAGTVVDTNSVVQVIVSSGNPVIMVPDMRGFESQEAIDTLSEIPFSIKIFSSVLS